MSYFSSAIPVSHYRSGQNEVYFQYCSADVANSHSSGGQECHMEPQFPNDTSNSDTSCLSLKKSQSSSEDTLTFQKRLSQDSL